MISIKISIIITFYDDEDFPVVHNPTRLLPWAHARNPHTRALGKSGVGLEHTVWGTNPGFVPVTQLPGG